jgi:DNA repair photolyase
MSEKSLITLTVDLNATGWSFLQRGTPKGENQGTDSNWPTLMYPDRNTAAPNGCSRGRLLRGHTTDEIIQQLETALDRFHQTQPFPQTRLILGSQCDLFLPELRMFDLALKTVEVMASRELGELWIQTRSPLVILTTPLLRARRQKCGFTIAFEPSMTQTTTALPKLSERLAIATTLQSLGFRLKAQLALAPKYDPKREQCLEVRRFLKSAASTFQQVRVVSPVELLPQVTSPFREAA